METGGIYITSASPRQLRHGGNFGVKFQITVPPRYNLDVETQGGDITVEAPLEGEAKLTTAGGDVRTSDVTGAVRIETAGRQHRAWQDRQRPDCPHGGRLHPRGRCKR